MTKISQAIMANENKDDDPFADYLWMGEMDKFDKEMEAQIEEEFEEEEFIRSCIEQLLDKEEERETVYFHSNDSDNPRVPVSQNNHDGQNIRNMNGLDPNLAQNMNNMYISNNQFNRHPQQQQSRSQYQNGPRSHSPNLWYSNKEPVPYSHARGNFSHNSNPRKSHYESRSRGRGNNVRRGPDFGNSQMCSLPEPWRNNPPTHRNVGPHGHPGPYPLSERNQQLPQDLVMKEHKISSLNPNAAPFVMNPNAKVFVPQSSPSQANQPQNQQQQPCREVGMFI